MCGLVSTSYFYRFKFILIKNKGDYCLHAVGILGYQGYASHDLVTKRSGLYFILRIDLRCCGGSNVNCVVYIH